MQALHKIGVTLEKVKWEHSIFALPFALAAEMLAKSDWLRLYQTLGLLFAWS